MRKANMIDRVVKELERRLYEGDGFTRLYMKDGRQLDIDLCVDGNYRICYPPYFYEGFTKWCKTLQEVARFVVEF